jgi:hypothetical protein
VTAPRPIRVTIDRLVLHGIAEGDAAALERAFRAEIESRLSAGTLDLSAPDGPMRLSMQSAGIPSDLGRRAGVALAQALAPPTGTR